MAFLKKIRSIEDSEKLDKMARISSDGVSDIVKKLGGTDNKADKHTIIDNFIVFTNASGGSGVSTIVSNIAYKISKMNFKVVVIDLNIMYPMQHTYLGIEQTADVKPDLVSFLTGKTKLGESIDSSHEYGIIYANDRTIADSINCNSDGSINNFNDMIAKLRKLFDIILVDCPSRVDDYLCNNAFYSCDAIYFVWDDGLAPITNTNKMRRNMSYSGIDAYTKSRVILNKRTNIHYSNYPFKRLNLDLVGVLPFDSSIIECSLTARIFCEKGSSNSKNAVDFEMGINELARKILAIGGLIDIGSLTSDDEVTDDVKSAKTSKKSK